MSAFVFLRLIFVVLAVVGISMGLPLAVAAHLGEDAMVMPFLVPMLSSVALGLFFFIRGRGRPVKFSVRSVYLFVALAWISISLLGTVPLYASGFFPSYADALFESVSGFSTTGATALSTVENLPASLNLWRCEMHWLGGMGIIALTVALLPLLGVDGFQLIKAESTGPEKGKITPKMANTAEVLWFLYFALTVVLAVVLRLLGMGWLDAVAHAFSTLSTGGFSTRDASIAHYGSPAIEWVCAVFMFLAGVNFSLYYYLWIRRFDDVRRNSELKAYLALTAVATLLISVFLAPSEGIAGAARAAFFQVMTVMTSTGYLTSDYSLWHPTAQFVLFALFFVGGSSGSTAGGFKVVRWCVLVKHAKNEMLRLLHPHGVYSLRLDGRSGRRELVGNVAAFAFVYALLVAATAILGTLARLDVFTSFATALSMVGNVGLSFGSLGPGGSPFGDLPAALKCWYCFAMIAGRLELYNLLIFFLREYWRR